MVIFEEVYSCPTDFAINPIRRKGDFAVEKDAGLVESSGKMNVGTEVVCIDDRFSAEVADQYAALPVKDERYHIRHIYDGRTLGHKTTTGVLLMELHNPPDIVRGMNTELGFAMDRFREVDELEEVEEMAEFEMEPEKIGFK